MKFLGYLLFPLFALFLSPISTKKNIITCAPSVYKIESTISTVQSGNWSDPATWGGRIPTSNDAPIINTGHTVFADVNSNIVGMQINGSLIFDASKSVTIQSTKNVIVNGLLEMLSPNPSVVHTLRFTGVNENNFVGGGMDVLATDVGLWVMGSGVLHLHGADKTSWTNATSSISASLIVNVNDATGWQVGDEIIITATNSGYSNFESKTISSINSNTLTLTSATTIHSIINNRWSAEVGNLTRNVRIEGTNTGRTHLFIRSSSPQYIQNVAFRYMGPRKDQDGDNISDLVLGRYGIHFHHCDDGSDGSVVQGCVMRDAGNHSYVPHVSNGITMRDNISYNCIETPFWWDLPDGTNRTSWVHNLVVQPQYIFHSMGFDTPGSQELGVHGFVLGMGDDNRCDSNVVTGQQGDEAVNGSYDWEEMDIESAWHFKDNLVHNSDCGLRTWQNNQKNHVIQNVTIYNTNIGVFHGAYGNNYTYDGGYLYASEFQDHAGSQENGVRLQNITLDGGGVINYPFHMVSVDANIKGQRPILIINSMLKNGKLGAILDESNILKNIDVINCNVSGVIKNTSSVETIRVQPLSGTPYQIKKAGTTNISQFAPTVWGLGNGLKGEYYNSTNFTSIALTRIDPIILFEEWMQPVPGNATGVHYSISGNTYSIRYTGYLQPQYSEPYTFKVNTGGGVRVYINNVLILNKWSEPYPTSYTSSIIQLNANQKYPIRVEYFNTDDKSNLSLYWKSTSLKQEIIPQSQLYSE